MMSSRRGRLVCTVCRTYFTDAISDLLQHIRLFHAHQPRLSIRCGIGGCERIFSNFGTYQNHISGYHRSESNPTNYSDHDGDDEATLSTDDNYQFAEEIGVAADEIQDSNDGDEAVNTSDYENLENEDYDNLSDEVSDEEEFDHFGLKKVAALFLLKLSECHKLTQAAIKSVIEGTLQLWQSYLECIHSEVIKLVEKSEDHNILIAKLGEVFDRNSAFGHPFSGIESRHNQLKYYKKKFGLLEPVRYVLGEKHVWQGIGRGRKCVKKQDTMMYVPFLKTLQILLKNRAIVTQVNSGHQSTSDYIEDFCDGSVYKSHPLFSVHSDGLQIFFYYDDVEICNPLGSKRSIHKLGFFYFSLGNLEPKYRSRVATIQLLGIVKKSVLDSYGMDAILKPFVDDLKKLECGYTFQIDGESKLVYGTLVSVSADNPASNSLGGFKESSSAFRPCRQCLTTHDELQTMEKQFILRDSASHKQHCQLVNGPSGLEYSKEYGINRESILDSLTYFCTCTGAMVPDVMHDILEGALQYEVKLMLKHFIFVEKYFTCDYLNAKLRNMELGYMESKDRPTSITESVLKSADNKLHQNAAQMLLLAKLLPLAIGDRVDRDDELWHCFLLMLEIVQYLFSPILNEDHAAYLQALISDHHFQFKQAYPHSNILPKMHYMVHMARLLLEYGPLIRLWTMRYEAKHSYFKQLAHAMGNFIHIEYSLAMRHQLLQCYYHTEQDSLFGDSLLLGPGKPILPSQLSGANIPHATSAYKTNWVKIGGYSYQRDAVVLMDRAPTFGRIKDIFLINKKDVVFCVTSFVVDNFLKHYNAFNLVNSIPCTTSLIMADSLIIPNPMHLHKICHKNLVVLPHHVDFHD